MSRILVIGGTGYAGSAITAEAVSRGHDTIAVSRKAPEDPIAGARYVQGSAIDAGVPLVAEADAVVAALSPRGDLTGTLLSVYQALAARTAETGARLVVVGGFGSLHLAPGAPRFAEGELDSMFAGEVREMDSIRAWFETSAPDGLDWLFVSPGLGFSAVNPGKATGAYRIGGTVALFDEAGVSDVSGADFALAVVDEIETRKHSGHIGVAY